MQRSSKTLGWVLLFFIILNFNNPNLFAQGNPAEGKTLFSFTCIACHTISEGDRIGPDLLNVTERREKEWIIRKLNDSKVMLEEGDPITVQNVAKFGEPMTPQGLSQQEVANIIAYLELEAVDKSNESESSSWLYIFLGGLGLIIAFFVIRMFRK